MSGIFILLSKARDGWLSHSYLQEFSLQFKHSNKHPHCITAVLLVRLGGPIALSSCTHPRIASQITMCALPEKLGKGRWGDALVFLHLLLLLLREAAEAGEQPAGKWRRETREYGCQTVAAGAPGRLLTQMLNWQLHSPRSDELKTHSWILIAVLCLRKASCNSVEVSVINLPRYSHFLWSSWCFPAGRAQKRRLTRALPAEMEKGTVSTSTESGKEHNL